MYLTFLFGIQVIVFQHISYSTKNHNTVLIHLSGLHLFGRSLIRTVSVEKKIQKIYNIKHKQIIKFPEFSAKKREKILKQTSILFYFSKTSNKN